MNKKLIKKFKEGKCTPEEIRKVLLWYQSDEAESSYSVEIENYWNTENNIYFPDQDRVFRQIQEKILASEHTESTEGKTTTLSQPFKTFKSGVRSSSYFLKIAAVVSLTLLASVGLYFSMPDQQAKESASFHINQLTKETSKGQKYTLKLADGTRVKLNSESRISFPDQFSDSTRTIEFEGEGFFEVAKDASRPFIIKSGNISTTVLGTSFNLRAISDKRKFEVSVLTGSVKVSHESGGNDIDERYLAPRQSATFDKQSNLFNVKPFDPEVVLAWVYGSIIFENASLEEIITKLESWYGVEIDTTAMKGRISKGYTGSYKDKSLESVLEGISFVLGFEFEIEGKKVLLYQN